MNKSDGYLEISDDLVRSAVAPVMLKSNSASVLAAGSIKSAHHASY